MTNDYQTDAEMKKRFGKAAWAVNKLGEIWNNGSFSIQVKMHHSPHCLICGRDMGCNQNNGKTDGQLRLQTAHPQNKVAGQSTYFKRKREDRSVPSQHHTSEKTSDLERTPDPHESGEATKAGHELEAARQKRPWQTTDDLEANHLTGPQRPGHKLDRMVEETVRLMRHSEQKDISISQY